MSNKEIWFNKVYVSSDKDSLVVRIEANDDIVTVYGRVVDDHPRWASEMQDLIKAVNPDITAHFCDEDRIRYHPNGPVKKRGYKYHHHVHSKYSFGETMRCIDKWLPQEIKQQIMEDNTNGSN